jgi:hypothetical protein
MHPSLLDELLPRRVEAKHRDFEEGLKGLVLALFGCRERATVRFDRVSGGGEGEGGVQEVQVEVVAKVNENFVFAGRKAEGGLAIGRVDEEGEDGLGEESVAGLRGVALEDTA